MVPGYVQGMSRVVPGWYQGGKGVPAAFLNIANAYSALIERLAPLPGACGAQGFC